MRRMELIAPCHFGLEAVLKREIIDLGYEISEVEDGRVTFIGDEEAICRANVFLRTAERILIKVGSFKATSFEELFEATKSLRWEEYIPRNGKFWVAKAASIKSKLFSPSDIQSIMKKAMVRRLQEYYGIEWFPEDGASYPVRVFLMKDIVTIGIDTSGVSLHKRGYREVSGKAPITETLAASLIMLTPWNKDRILVDPFCGSGTFPIEAAMMAANIAPGMNRSFTAESWMNIIPKKVWYDTIDEANDLIQDDVEVDIQGYDLDSSVIKIARRNAREAGVNYIVLPDIDSESRNRMLALEAQHPEMLFPLAGLHPTSVYENYKAELAQVEKALGNHTFYGIGECGIDLYWDKRYYREQIKAFEHQLGIAKETGLPVIIHSRDSLEVIFEVLKKHPYTRGILHCFPGNAAEARQAIDMGYLLGIGGVVTFKKSQMADTLREIGPANIVLETDSPYLTPVPFRGKRNESSYIPLIAQKIAELTGLETKKIEEITTQNALNLFNLQCENV